MTDERGLTDSELVAALRSDDADDRRRAMDELYPNELGACLVRCKPKETQISTTSGSDPERMFMGLLHLAVRFGDFLGLGLHWLRNPEDDSKIQVAPAGSIREN